MKNSNGLIVERAVEPQSLSIDNTVIDCLDAYPVTAVVQHLPQDIVSEFEAATTSDPESRLYRSNLFADDARAVNRRPYEPYVRYRHTGTVCRTGERLEL
jgi:hypothetical protein